MASKEVAERAKRREADIKELLTSKDYYDGRPILGKNGDFNIIWGMRSNGKTYFALKYALENYKKTKRTFVYCRRWAEDIVVKNMSKLMSPLPVEDIFGPGYTIKFYRGAFILQCDDDDVEDEVIGWAVALNQVAHTKGQTFVGTQVIIFDEFLQMAGERSLKDERDSWEQTLSTILRTTQDAKIFMLGNSVTKYSWVFTTYGIDINRMKQGEIKVIEMPNSTGEPTRICAQWCEYNPKIGERTSKYVINSKMARTGEFEIQDVANIPHTDNEIASEKLLCSMYDHVMNLNLGIFLRNSTWQTYEIINGIYTTRKHNREFLVIRETAKQSSFYHLTRVKDLKYSTWTNVKDMFKDILENTEIDIINELKMGRVFAENMFTADYFFNTYINYQDVSLRDLL